MLILSGILSTNRHECAQHKSQQNGNARLHWKLQGCLWPRSYYATTVHLNKNFRSALM
jgi:hypothetical protein